MVRPMPRDAPVTIAVFLMVVLLFGGFFAKSRLRPSTQESSTASLPLPLLRLLRFVVLSVFSLSIHSRMYSGQFSSFMPSASQSLRNLTAWRCAPSSLGRCDRHRSSAATSCSSAHHVRVIGDLLAR